MLCRKSINDIAAKWLFHKSVNFCARAECGAALEIESGPVPTVRVFVIDSMNTHVRPSKTCDSLCVWRFSCWSAEQA
jgi:hypothetical protein